MNWSYMLSHNFAKYPQHFSPSSPFLPPPIPSYAYLSSVLVTVVNLVKDGVASPPFNTYEALSSYLNVIITFLPTSLTFVPIRTSLAEGRGNGGRQGALYYSMSVRSLNESVAPAGCPAAALGVIQPIPNNSKNFISSST